ncbi:hypothetical protein EVAR_94190_1 [Eumeta japonica]|uniref:Uncharacterized protein n=1 Tax=Eumeta variegata TaxID=151549 RepID=A0A4C1UP13_EUMVA|nr:hypothetical protein EVAR_94190_1 [Eumeta japonica]
MLDMGRSHGAPAWRSAITQLSRARCRREYKRIVVDDRRRRQTGCRTELRTINETRAKLISNPPPACWAEGGGGGRRAAGGGRVAAPRNHVQPAAGLSNVEGTKSKRGDLLAKIKGTIRSRFTCATEGARRRRRHRVGGRLVTTLKVGCERTRKVNRLERCLYISTSWVDASVDSISPRIRFTTCGQCSPRKPLRSRHSKGGKQINMHFLGRLSVMPRRQESIEKYERRSKPPAVSQGGRECAYEIKNRQSAARSRVTDVPYNKDWFFSHKKKSVKTNINFFEKFMFVSYEKRTHAPSAVSGVTTNCATQAVHLSPARSGAPHKKYPSRRAPAGRES